MKYDTIIAIDPDVDKSGVAELRPQHRLLEVTNLTFPQLLEYLQSVKKEADTVHTSLVVVVEKSWGTTHNWHGKAGDTKGVQSRKGYDQGRSHETGRKIVECAKAYGIDVHEQTPLRKCWKGADGKITHEELQSFTGLSGRTNQDARDAALLAWNFANLPIRIKP